MKRFVGGLMRGGPSNHPAEPTTVWLVVKRASMSRAAIIDFRMLRRAFLERVLSGEVPRHDACDANMDLMRAAHHHGVARRTACPVCAQQELRNVTYLFGPRLPKSGKCVTSTQVLREIDGRPEHFTAYTVEVCLSCQWNHVLSASPYGGRRTRTRVRRQA
jgi:hypothetical protein